jgi:hypothetical protein
MKSPQIDTNQLERQKLIQIEAQYNPEIHPRYEINE